MTSETLHLLRDDDPGRRLWSNKTALLLLGGGLALVLLLAGWVTAPFTIGSAPNTISSISAFPLPGHPGQYEIRIRASRTDGGCVSSIWELSDYELVDGITGKPLALAQQIYPTHVSATRYYWNVVLLPTFQHPPETATPVSVTAVATTYPAAARLQWLRWRFTGAPTNTPRSLAGNLLAGRVTLPAALRR